MKKRFMALLLTLSLLVSTLPMGSVAEAATVGAFSSEEVNNMLVGSIADGVGDNFPSAGDNAVLKWAVPVGTGFAKGEPTNPVYANGYLYMVGYNPEEDDMICLKKLDPQTGVQLGKKELCQNTGFNFFLTLADDKLFVMEGNMVEAFDLELNQLWVSDDVQGAQGLCPVTYADGRIYAGTCGSEKAGFFCINAENGGKIWLNMAELDGEAPQYRGSYWAGGCVVGDYVIYGSSGGRVYVAKTSNGKIVTRCDIGSGADIRSSIAYLDGRLYFTAIDGNVYGADFDAVTGAITNLKSAKIGTNADDSATATPVVYDGRLYVGSKHFFAVFNAADLTPIHQVSHNLGILRDLRLLNNDEQACVYAFTTYYAKPGGVVIFKVFDDAALSPVMYNLGGLMTSDMQEFCASMPIFGPDGTIYASNDAGYLAAYTKGGVFLNSLSADKGSFTNSFNKQITKNELVVPIGTDKVTLGMTADEGVTVTVDGTPVADGSYEVSLTNSAAEVKIEVSKGSSKLVYTVNIRPIRNNAEISVVVNESNNIEENPLAVAAYGATDDVFLITGANSNTRIWLAAKDEHASLGTPSVPLYGRIGYDDGLNAANGYDGLVYSARFYDTAAVYPLALSTSAIAENGTDKPYYIVAIPDATYNGTDTYVYKLGFNEEKITLFKPGAKRVLQPELGYIGQTPSVSWRSSAPEIVAVDENGEITAKAYGSAKLTMTATGAAGNISAECEVNVKPYLTVYMTYSKGDYVVGSDAAQTELCNVAIDVKDMDADGTITIDDAFATFHEKYCAAGKDGYASTGYITKFWGEDTYNVSYVLNDSTKDGDGNSFTTQLELKDNDRINAFYYQDTVGYAYSDVYTYFDKRSEQANVNTAKSFTVNGYSVMYEMNVVPKGATVKVYDRSGEVAALATVVGDDGKFSISFPAAGEYTIELGGTVEYTGPYGSYPAATIVPSRCVVTVSEPSSGGGGGVVSSDIAVKFRLIGSTESENGVDMENGVDDAKYVTWLATKTYKVPKGSTTLDLFKTALDEAGIAYDVDGTGWLQSITAPAAAGGYTLGNMDNGTYSGWMYTLNNKHEQAILGSTTLKNGDSFIVHYINDYRYEDSQWTGGSMGTAAQQDRWLKAKDVDPTGTANSGNTAGSGSSSVSTTVTPVVSVNEKGEGKVSMTTAEVKVIIAEAKEAGANEIVVAPKLSGEANRVAVNIPAISAKAVGKDANADLKVKTDIADIKISSDDLSKLGASGNLTVSAEKNSDGTVDVTVTANGKNVTLSKGSITVEKKSAGANDVLVIVKADGTEEVIKKSVTDKDGIAAVIDGSCTVKVVSKDVDFADTNAHWSKEAAEFVAAREIFNGTGAKTFAPNDKMDRQMVATVLWRLENEVKSDSTSKFNDEVAGWAKEAVVWAADKQIVNGDENGNFNGDQSVSRQELAAMLYRYAKAVGMDTTVTGSLSKFTDNGKVADWATEAMKWAVGSGLMKGNEDGTINPNGTATRGEVATVIMRLIENAVR